MTLPLYDKAMQDFHRMFRKQEAQNGLLCDEPGDCFVCDEDREPSVEVSLTDDIPPSLFSGMPRDPYGCENPVSQSEEE